MSRFLVSLLVALWAMAWAPAHAVGTVSGGSVAGFCFKNDNANSVSADPGCQASLSTSAAGAAAAFAQWYASAQGLNLSTYCAPPSGYTTYAVDGSGPTVIGVVMWPSNPWYEANNNCGANVGSLQKNRAAATVSGCPANSTGTGTCTCNTGYRPNTAGTACESTTSTCQTIVDGANLLLPQSFFSADGALPGSLSTCNSGCQVGAQGSTVVRDPATGTSKTLYFGPYTLISNTCTETPAAPAPAQTNTCPIGTAPITIGTQTTCVAQQSTTTQSAAAASAPAGAASAPDYRAGLPDGGSVSVPAGGSVSGSTTCSGAQCTTTTIVRNSSGTEIGRYTTNTPNPGAPGGGGVGDGSGEDEELDCETLNTCDDDEAGTMPEQPTLYEKKYPDGIEGVWDDKKDALQATALGSLASSIFPTGLTTGTSPSWTFDFDFGGVMDLGQVELAPTDTIWAGLRLFLIACTTIFAVRLVLGGS